MNNLSSYSVPQLKAIKSELIKQTNTNVPRVPNPDYPLQLKAIDKEIKWAQYKPKSNKLVSNGKYLNPYNRSRAVVPKGWISGVPLLFLSELVTNNAAKPLAAIYNEVPDAITELKNAFGLRDEKGTIGNVPQWFQKQDRYTKAKNRLEWDNAANYFNYLLTKGSDPNWMFNPDDLIDLPEWIEGKNMVQQLWEKKSELLKAAPNTHISKTHWEPGKGLAPKIDYQKF